ncbi:MAG: hypothetical protein RL346_1192 [Verrucomicrobiota bacterium]
MSAQAQLATSISVQKKEFVAGEPVIAEVIVTNHTGREITLAGTAELPWLTFVLTNNQGNVVPISKKNVFGAMHIRAGESLAKRVDLTEFFLLNNQGNYAVSAVIRDPQKRVSGASTNRVLFSLNPGRTYWSQRVGVKTDATGMSTREMKIITFSNGRKNQVYAQIIDGTSGMPLNTFVLGEYLTLRKPMVTLDGQQRMHVMFLSTPSMWVHCQIDTDGKLVKRDIHQAAAKGDPVMMAYGDGSVRILNSVIYDQEAAAKARSSIRRISERPW